MGLSGRASSWSQAYFSFGDVTEYFFHLLAFVQPRRAKKQPVIPISAHILLEGEFRKKVCTAWIQLEEAFVPAVTEKSFQAPSKNPKTSGESTVCTIQWHQMCASAYS